MRRRSVWALLGDRRSPNNAVEINHIKILLTVNSTYIHVQIYQVSIILLY